VIEYTESGHGRKEACEVFGVCLRSVTKWIKLGKETGSLSIDHVPRGPQKLYKEELTAYVKANPGAYIREIADHF
jgi:transposase